MAIPETVQKALGRVSPNKAPDGPEYFATQAEAMEQLVAAVQSVKLDGSEPRVVQRTADYLRVEYVLQGNPLLSLADDTEFFFPGGELSRVEYRSTARSSLPLLPKDTERRRIRALREALQKKGWRSVGF